MNGDDTDSHDADVIWLDPDQQRSWRAYLVGTTLLMDRLDRDLRENHDLSMPEYEILVRLSEAPDRRMRMAELAGSVSHSRSRITHTVARLEKAGLVTR
jgi:DNA-binding MarR family transcriptional regulator